jgi:hypothetical protein
MTIETTRQTILIVEDEEPMSACDLAADRVSRRRRRRRKTAPVGRRSTESLILPDVDCRGWGLRSADVKSSPRHADAGGS